MRVLEEIYSHHNPEASEFRSRALDGHFQAAPPSDVRLFAQLIRAAALEIHNTDSAPAGTKNGTAQLARAFLSKNVEIRPDILLAAVVERRPFQVTHKASGSPVEIPVSETSTMNIGAGLMKAANAFKGVSTERLMSIIRNGVATAAQPVLHRVLAALSTNDHIPADIAAGLASPEIEEYSPYVRSFMLQNKDATEAHVVSPDDFSPTVARSLATNILHDVEGDGSISRHGLGNVSDWSFEQAGRLVDLLKRNMGVEHQYEGLLTLVTAQLAGSPMNMAGASGRKDSFDGNPFKATALNNALAAIETHVMRVAENTGFRAPSLGQDEITALVGGLSAVTTSGGGPAAGHAQMIISLLTDGEAVSSDLAVTELERVGLDRIQHRFTADDIERLVMHRPTFEEISGTCLQRGLHSTIPFLKLADGAVESLIRNPLIEDRLMGAIIRHQSSPLPYTAMAHALTHRGEATWRAVLEREGGEDVAARIIESGQDGSGLIETVATHAKKAETIERLCGHVLNKVSGFDAMMLNRNIDLVVKNDILAEHGGGVGVLSVNNRIRIAAEDLRSACKLAKEGRSGSLNMPQIHRHAQVLKAYSQHMSRSEIAKLGALSQSLADAGIDCSVIAPTRLEDLNRHIETRYGVIGELGLKVNSPHTAPDFNNTAYQASDSPMVRSM